MGRVARNVGLVVNFWRTRTLWACGLALLMILGTAATLDATPGQIVYVQSKGAEVHAEPNRKAQVIARLRRGHKVIEFERRSGWVRIGMFDTSGRDGWVSARSVSTLTDTVIVDSKATGGFGYHPDAAPPAGGTPMVLGFVFGAPSAVAIIATGEIDLYLGLPELEDISPDGTAFDGDNFNLTRALNFSYMPLEEASVDGGADFTAFSDTLPDAGALMGAFVPKSTVDSPGFSPKDEDFGVPGIRSDQLFFIGSGPFEFKANEPGTLFLGINDSRASNNTGSFEVTLRENVCVR